MMSKIIGTTKLTDDGKITLIADVSKKLDVHGGDVIVFEDNEKREYDSSQGVKII